LAVFPIGLPALRDRDGDVELLTAEFLEKFSTRHGKRLDGIDPEAASALNRFSWPGNVRELENIIERAVILEDGKRISLASIPADVIESRHDAPAGGSNGVDSRSATASPPHMRGPGPFGFESGPAPSIETATTLEEIAPFAEEERRIILRALQAARWNVQEAAERLELGRATIYRKIERYGLRSQS
jgi:DNA-binding NtrC family response regulator